MTREEINEAAIEREAGMRSQALQQAAHDFKGGKSAEETVARAELYYAFLSGDGRLSAMAR